MKQKLINLWNWVAPKKCAIHSVSGAVWVYGYCKNRHSRKNKLKGNVQFVLWEKGDQKDVDGIGHTKDKWHNFGVGHETDFKPYGMPTHTIDLAGKNICLGDIVDYDFKGDDPYPFKVVFEDNAFRKEYKDWDITLPRPLLEYGEEAKTMRLKLIKTYH